MQLSPFESRITEDSWPHKAQLYGRPGLPDPRGHCTFEVFPAWPDEDVSDYQWIPRDDEQYDEGAIGFDITDAESGTEYVLMTEAGERPTLKWYSQKQFRRRFGYNPLDPPCPSEVRSEKWEQFAEEQVRGKTESTVRLDTDRITLLKRIAGLWNGEVVCGVHLLADRCPTIRQIASDLDEESLNRLYYNTNLDRDVIVAFGDADWFETASGFLKPTSVFRKQAWYDLNEKGRLLINNRSEFSTLTGDPYEGLVHRITVGLVTLFDKLPGWDLRSYYNFDNYTLDVYGIDSDHQAHAYEIFTEHHNWKLYRKTYRKMESLNKRGIEPIAVFDSRETAYMVFNHWHREGLGELPNGAFESVYSVKNGRKQIIGAYQSDSYDWAVADWTTTWKLKERIFGPDGPEFDRDQIVSLDW